MSLFLRSLLGCLLVVLGTPSRAVDVPPSALVVFGAASLTNVLQDIGTAYTAQRGSR